MSEATVYNARSLPTNDNLNPYSFCLDVQGEVFIRKGKMIAYYGDLRFEALGSSQFDFLIRKSFGAPEAISDFVIVTGRGKLILGDGGNHVASYNLEEGNLTVKADHILGFSQTLVCEECVMPGYLTLLGTGIFLASSNGAVHFMEPPVRVDEQALLGWADLPCPSYRYDYSYVQGVLGALGSLTGITASGEEKQINFVGKGTVLIQSSEESLHARSDLAALLARITGLDRSSLESVKNTVAARLGQRDF
jgi:uncharacterized protein (AIM24 family)